MEFKYPNSKKLYLTVEISQLLYRHNCTYNEAEEILKLTADEIKQQRENFEYDTFAEFMDDKKSKSADNEIIHPMNHVEPYC